MSVLDTGLGSECGVCGLGSCLVGGLGQDDARIQYRETVSRNALLENLVLGFRAFSVTDYNYCCYRY